MIQVHIAASAPGVPALCRCKGCFYNGQQIPKIYIVTVTHNRKFQAPL